jgi:hypothetical protein
LRAQGFTLNIIASRVLGELIVQREGALTQAERDAVEQMIAAAPTNTPRLQAADEIDRLPIAMRAIVLTLLDAINVLRVREGLSAITPAQAFTAIRNKINELE